MAKVISKVNSISVRFAIERKFEVEKIKRVSKIKIS